MVRPYQSHYLLRESESDQPIGLRVVLAEDNRLVQDVVARALGAKGLEVVRISNGLDVLNHVNAHASSIGLIILDVDLPGRSGSYCHLDIREKYPTLPIIMMTGSPDYRLPSREDPHTVLLRKPFNVQRLFEAISVCPRGGAD